LILPAHAHGLLAHAQSKLDLTLTFLLCFAAGFAAIMASTYKAYLGEGLGPLEFIKQFHIPHPGRVIGRAVLHLTMPAVLDWVLGGNNDHLARVRPSACRVEDKLKVSRAEERQQDRLRSSGEAAGQAQPVGGSMGNQHLSPFNNTCAW
jgi:hypothetical protein